MANELQQVYEADGREITLNPAVITQYVLNGSNSPVLPSEMAKTIMTCAARKLDPFAGDVHILPHWDKDTGTTKLSVSPSIDFYQRRAMANPRYRGIRDGIVVVVNGEIVKKHGCAVYQELGETLIGGWAEVYVEGYEKSVYVEVSLSEYNTHKALWKYKPATMINKVAKAQALRKAFPDEFMGLYEPSELGIEEPKQDEGARSFVSEITEEVYENPSYEEEWAYESPVINEEQACEVEF